MSFPPPPRMALPRGWISFFSAVVAFSKSSGLVIFTCTELPTTPSPVKPILASRNCLRLSSRKLVSQSFSSPFVSMASNRCAPPRRSRPSGSCWCGSQRGQLSTVSLEKKFGIVKSTPARQVRTMAMIFQRSKCSINQPILFAVLPTRAQQRSGRVFRRVALAAHVHQRRLQDANAHGLRQLDLDLVGGIGGLRDLADETARSDDRVAAAHLIDQLAVGF